MMSFIEKNLPEFLPLKEKYSGPKFDSHVHLRTIDDIKEMIPYANNFGITKMLGIVHEDEKEKIDDNFPDKFISAKFLNFKDYLEGKQKKALQSIEELYQKEYSVAKLWFAPRWKDWVKENWNVKTKLSSLTLDSDLLEPFFAKLEQFDLPLLLHVSDPDLLYNDKYKPEEYYGKKDDHLKALENILKRHPNLLIIGAHMAGQPEHLDNLERVLEENQNLYVDTASAKWMARSFATQKQKAKEFFETYSKRILFGTDIVSGRKDREPIPGYYIHRYLSYQKLWETNTKKLSLPIPDPDNNNKTKIEGLNLRDETLRDIYWNTANNLFSL